MDIKSKRLGWVLILILSVSSFGALIIQPSIAWEIWAQDGIAPPPVITWRNPNGHIKYGTSMPLEFTITFQRTEEFPRGNDIYRLHIIEYSIDGGNTTSIQGEYYQDNLWSSGKFRIDTSELTSGFHNITVTAYFTILWANIGVPHDCPYTFPNKSFQIKNQITLQPTPSPTSPYPTNIAWTARPLITSATGPHTEAFPISTVLFVASIFSAVVVVSLLLYVRRLKRNTIKPDNSAV